MKRRIRKATCHLCGVELATGARDGFGLNAAICSHMAVDHRLAEHTWGGGHYGPVRCICGYQDNPSRMVRHWTPEHVAECVLLKSAGYSPRHITVPPGPIEPTMDAGLVAGRLKLK